MLQESGVLLLEIPIPIWKEAPDIIEIIAKILGALTTIALFFKRVRVKVYSIYDYLYSKLPYVKAYRQKINEIADSMKGFGTQLDRIEHRGIVNEFLVWNMVDSSYDAKILTDKFGRWVKVNITLLGWLGVRESNVIGEGWVQYISSATVSDFVQKYQDAIDHQRGLKAYCTFKNNGILQFDAEINLKANKIEGVLYGFEITIKKL